MPADLLVATRSADKLSEIRTIISAAAHVRLLSLYDAGISWTAEEEEIETHPTFTGNAAAKAIYFAQRSGMPVLADDSGLCVNALRGGPGVRTRRFAIDAGVAAPDLSGRTLDEANNTLLLEKLATVPDHERAAHYVCAAAYAVGGAIRVTALATCSGEIARARHGEGGFGYDPLFLIPETGMTFAQLTRAQKNVRSHRARAFRAITSHLK